MRDHVLGLIPGSLEGNSSSRIPGICVWTLRMGHDVAMFFHCRLAAVEPFGLGLKLLLLCSYSQSHFASGRLSERTPPIIASESSRCPQNMDWMNSPNPKLNPRTWNRSESFVKGHLEFTRAWQVGTCQRGLRSRLRNFLVLWRKGRCRSLWICRDSVKPVMAMRM